MARSDCQLPLDKAAEYLIRSTLTKWEKQDKAPSERTFFEAIKPI